MAISNPKNKPITPAGFDTDSMNRSLRLINAFTAIYPPQTITPIMTKMRIATLSSFFLHAIFTSCFILILIIYAE